MTTRRIAAALVYSLTFSSLLDAQTITVRDATPPVEKRWYDRFTVPYLPVVPRLASQL